MKNILCLLSIIFLFAGCAPGDDAGNPGDALAGSSVLLLKVDYLTRKFEGGTEQSVMAVSSPSDSIPLRIDYKSPGDFGSIALYFKPDDKLLFSGTMIWMGKGAITYPAAFKPAANYPSGKAISYPGNSRFVYYMQEFKALPKDYTDIWKAVSNLRIVGQYLQAGKKIGLVAYTPSVGFGNPADWDYLVILYK
ncbi:hypothetical protein [Hufsiella ginkgonis]|uniref:DUF4384 domain-containing protein n=1 Tax=Hufsiella ginkgonis TaxID=2695274 RepID=A0A7K1XUE6_9SPHI|nr:hypothetical protein [Hufsiella ginkgonis]MXV14389.1 hypothetical protein [Hufsiella ginkgonis]